MHPCAGRPHRGFGGAVQVPQRAATRQQLRCQLRRQGFATAQHRERRIALPAGFKQQPPCGRCCLHQRGSPLRQQPHQCAAIDGGIAIGEDHLCAHAQRQQQLQNRDVERQCGDCQQPIIGLHRWRDAHGVDEIRHRAMRHAHALGAAGGAGGVDHVGDRFGPGAVGIGADALRRRLRQFLHQLIQRQHRPTAQIEGLGVRALRDQRRQTCIAGHIGKPLGGKPRVERHVASAALEDAKQGRDHVDAAIQCQPDQSTAMNPARTQQMGDAICAGLQLRVADRCVARPQRDPLRRLVALPLEVHVHGAFAIECAGGRL